MAAWRRGGGGQYGILCRQSRGSSEIVIGASFLNAAQRLTKSKQRSCIRRFAILREQANNSEAASLCYGANSAAKMSNSANSS